MMKKKNSDNFQGIEVEPVTIFAEDTELSGNLTFKKPVEIRGKFKGSIDSESVLIINNSAEVEADIKAKIVIIAGKVKGNIESSEKVDLLPTGKLYGDIKTAKLKIADGVIFEGSCHMIK